jgi:hypothetical protein
MSEQDGAITRRRRFAQIPDDLITDKRLSAWAVRVWARLDKYAGEDGRAFPYRATLADDIGCSVATIKRALAELVDTGWIIRRRRNQFSNVWDTELMDSPDGSSVTHPTGHGRPARRVTDDPPKEGDPIEGDPSPSPPPAAPSPPAVPRQNGGGSHPHHTNTANAISEHLHEAGLPADLHGPILEACYRIGHGNPWRAWTDSPIRDHLADLGGAHNPVAVIKARLRDTRPLPPSRPATAPCPLHPGQPAGRCPRCAREAAKPPAGWRKTRNTPASGDSPRGSVDLAG